MALLTLVHISTKEFTNPGANYDFLNYNPSASAIEFVIAQRCAREILFFRDRRQVDEWTKGVEILIYDQDEIMHATKSEPPLFCSKIPVLVLAPSTGKPPPPSRKASIVLRTGDATPSLICFSPFPRIWSHQFTTLLQDLLGSGARSNGALALTILIYVQSKNIKMNINDTHCRVSRDENPLFTQMSVSHRLMVRLDLPSDKKGMSQT
ncbi:hypothetical protein EAG_06301 [Camponotus floridanus]|uniref:Uncharacterized protein n=1 Tax=Camponotus floridanus TaxID=104421 RepID=E2A511_CAMFO|nr:hypothetical protein EAG_06301 [Camponotus floridanus]